MRNIGVIFILVLIGMLIWKASDQEPPSQSTRLASAAADPQVKSGAQLPRSIDLNSPVIPTENSRFQNHGLVITPSEEPVAETPGVERSPEASEQKTESEDNLEANNREFERIIIPSIKVNANVVPKPYSELTWDITNLGHDVAALEDIPNQTSDNNLVFAGHVTVHNGSHGPFRYLFRLTPGDRVILQDASFSYTYVVREQILVYPEESSVLNDTPHQQLTLITCTTWDEETLSYLRRRIIFADLEKIESNEVLLD
jgi:LPXTG-site transpeptidase (sortase) family protein